MNAAPAFADAAPVDPDLTIVPDFITEAERTGLLAWARAMRPHLKANPNGDNRYSRRMEFLPRVDPLHAAVRLRLQRQLGLPDDIAPEPRFGWYISIIGAGGYVHMHQDPTPEGMRHLRANLFLQLPFHGGRPAVERNIYPVAERSLLAFFPSERRHFSEPVYGRRRRIILSFGYLVPADYVLPALTGVA